MSLTATLTHDHMFCILSNDIVNRNLVWPSHPQQEREAARKVWDPMMDDFHAAFPA
jgi:hypothetical protein